MATDETDISKEISRINAAKDKIKSNFVALGISAEDSDLTQMAADSDNLPDFFSQLIDNVHPLDRMTTGTYASVDNYTTAGLYWLVKSTVTDTPNTGSGLLIVTTSTKGNIIYQTFISYNTTSGYFATRCYTNSQWYGWDRRPAPADYVTSQGTSGAWFYRIWASGRKECWLQTSIMHEIKQQDGSLYYSSTVPYPYPVSFTAKPTLYIGVRSPNNKPIWAIPSTPASDPNVKNNAYMEFVTGTSTTSISTDIYAYACGM